MFPLNKPTNTILNKTMVKASLSPYIYIIINVTILAKPSFTPGIGIAIATEIVDSTILRTILIESMIAKVVIRFVFIKSPMLFYH